MKKFVIIISLCLIMFTAKSHAVSYYAAWNFLYHGQYINLCPNLNSNDPSIVDFIHVDQTIYDSSGYYVLVSFVMGYDLTNQHSGFINSREIGTITDYLICTSNYVSNNAVNVQYFDGLYHVYAGRIYQWLIPKNYIVSGYNPIVLNFKGQSVNFGITAYSSSSSSSKSVDELIFLDENNAQEMLIQDYYDLKDSNLRINQPMIKKEKNIPTEGLLD